MESKLKIGFLGTPDIVIPSLETLASNENISLDFIVSQPSRASGRGQKKTNSPVVDWAIKNSIRLFQPEKINKDETLLKHIESNQLDALIVFAYAQFLSKKILNSTKHGCFNIHTSLLPKYRGAAPIQHAILNGDSKTGVCIQKMVSKMDAGDIVGEKEVQITELDNAISLSEKLKIQSANLMHSFINDLLNDSINFKKQNESEVSFAPIIKKSDGKLNFLNENIKYIQRKIRAFQPWPGCYCFLNKKRLKILSVESVDNSINPGEVKADNGRLIIGCADGAMRITNLQLEGKKSCSDSELLNGIRGAIEIS